MRLRLLAATLALFAAPAVWAQGVPEETASFGNESADQRLLVRGATDLAFIAPALQAFVEAWPEFHVTFEPWNSNDLYLSAVADCVENRATADILMSSSVDQLVKLVNDGCAQAHNSLTTASLDDGANWRDELFGVTSEPVVMVYNRALVPAGEAPASRFNLLDLLRREGPRYAGRVATYDIEGSGVGYLFAFLDSEQATTFGALMEAFGRTDTVATCCSAEIVDAVASGRFLIAYNVLGSYALARAAKDPNLAVVAPSDYTLLLSRSVMIPKGASNPFAAGLLIDFLVSAAGQRALAQTGLILDAEDLEELGVAEATLRPIPLSPVLLVGLDAQKRSRLLDLWRATFPRS